ncbi:hypothetical protein BJ741DRAFT_320573 [Chytriomyces cf. hyalinus JEL632]|nr:hypothetical protein BJ741DRAFT_320573 [Chytriomyces cf. hyalinus JEL632]
MDPLKKPISPFAFRKTGASPGKTQQPSSDSGKPSPLAQAQADCSSTETIGATDLQLTVPSIAPSPLNRFSVATSVATEIRQCASPNPRTSGTQAASVRDSVQTLNTTASKSMPYLLPINTCIETATRTSTTDESVESGPGTLVGGRGSGGGSGRVNYGLEEDTIALLMKWPDGWENQEFDPKYDLWRRTMLEALLCDHAMAEEDSEYPLVFPPDLALLLCEEEV